MHLLAIFLLLSTAIASAQDPLLPVVTVHLGKAPTLATFRKEIADQQGCLVILPGEDPRWATSLNDLLKKEPLSDMEVYSRTVLADSPLGRELRVLHGWSAAPRWALLGRDLKLLCQGTTIPGRPELLAVELQAVGWKTRLEVVTDFLRKRPDHLEAQWERINLLFALAERRVKPLLADGKDDELRRPLAEDEDRRIFGPLARALEAVLKDPAFVSGMRGVPAKPGVEGYSPVILALARKGRPILEAELRRNGTDNDLWALWAYFQALCPGDALGLLASIPTVDGEPPFLQTVVLPPLLKQARATGRWEPFLALALRSWRSSSAPNMGFVIRPDFRQTWESQASMVIEAQLRLGRLGEADGTVQDFLAWSGEPAAAAWASRLAQACGQFQRAKMWRGLQPPSGAGARFAALPEKIPEHGSISARVQGGSMDATDLPTFLKAQGGNTGLLLIRLKTAMPGQGRWSPEEMAWNNAWWKTRSHPAVEALELPEREVAMDSRTGKELRGVRGWGSEPRWVLVDMAGQIQGSGTEIPAPEEMVRVVRATGYLSRYERVEAFLREHPGHPETLRELLSLTLARAQRSQQRLDEPIRAAKQRREEVERLFKDPAMARDATLQEPKKAPVGEEDGTEATAAHRAHLSKVQAMLMEYEHPPEPPPVKDAPEWADVARALESLLDQPDWAGNSYSSSGFWMEAAPQSPIFQRAAQNALPKVEALLLRCPTDGKVWEMWRHLLQVSGVFKLEILDQIQRPGCPDGPPEQVAWELEDVLKIAGRWAELRPRLLSRWEDWLTKDSDERTGNYSEFDSLIAADLHLGFTQEAEARLEILLKAFGEGSAQSILESASRIAKECNLKELAEAWHQRSQAMFNARMDRQKHKE